MSDDFDWNAMEDDLVVNPARRVAAYFNPRGEVVIRQEDNDFFGMDPFIVIPTRDVPRLIEKLRDLVQSKQMS
jgi:hypothetical protein